MAYLIVNTDNQLYRIAANETDKNNFNCSMPPYTAIDISDADFLKVKQNLVITNISNGTATFTNIDYTDYTIQESMLVDYHKDVIQSIKSFLDANPNNSFYTEANNYRNYLLGLDYSSLPLPISQTWEKYCQDNSIAYIHPLQIP